jgi:hypothetical protein
MTVSVQSNSSRSSQVPVTEFEVRTFIVFVRALINLNRAWIRLSRVMVALIVGTTASIYDEAIVM